VVHILSGSVLLVWSQVEQILVESSNSAEVKMQVIRVRGADFRIIGLLIPNSCIHKLKNVLTDERYAGDGKGKEVHSLPKSLKVPKRERASPDDE